MVGSLSPSAECQPSATHTKRNRWNKQMNIPSPTPYSDVNEILGILLVAAKRILNDQFTGMYLYGSLSSGDFNPETSDIDFLFVTRSILPAETIAKLESMHKQTWAHSHRRAGELEGAYVPKELIRRHDANGAPCPTINEGRFYVAPLGSDWIIQRHVVREYGVIIEGPDPKSLIDFVSPNDIRGAVMGVLCEWWFPMLEDPSWLRNNHRGYHSYAILSMCRAMHALQHSTIVSKPVAARWAQETLDARWSQVIERALLAQKPNTVEFELLDDAIQLIQYTKDITIT